MSRVPRDMGVIHFTGIGGIGMSGIAEVMHNLGYRVQGSDITENANVRRLSGLGVPVTIGHAADSIAGAGFVVVSSAVSPDNVEVIAARARAIPIVRRAEMLAELMRLKSCVAVAGTHGKTTTTSMIAALLDAGGFDPTVINGGIINAYGVNARLGTGDWMVVEADESDGSFVRLPAATAVVTGIDPEHMDHYGNFDAVRDAYRTFIENIPFYGLAVLCLDHPELRAFRDTVEDRRIITYGMASDADVRATNMRHDGMSAVFDVTLGERCVGGPITGGIRLPMPGFHNIQNALAAIAVAADLAIPMDAITTGLSAFAGVKRRFTRTGSWNGVAVYDDYAHHPVEIAATLSAARAINNGDRLVAVVQPHRYSRLRDHFEAFVGCFDAADAVVVLPVHAAGESPISGIDHHALAKGLRKAGRTVVSVDDPADLAVCIRDLVSPGDKVVCMGAGDITHFAGRLPAELEKIAQDAETGAGNGAGRVA